MPGATALLPLSWLFGGAVRLRSFLYDHEMLPIRRLPAPVLSIGNLTVGGTGKTPLVAFLARQLVQRGRRPVIVSRGYGGDHHRRRGTEPLLVAGGGEGAPLASAADAGDEPYLLASVLPGVPLAISRDRHRGGLAALEAGGDLVILDDGFQHRRLHRDADLVTLDAAAPLASDRLLPAGRLREPVTALARAHAAVITRADEDGDYQRTGQLLAAAAPELPLYRSRHRPTLVRFLSPAPGKPEEIAASALAGIKVAAFAGLAYPLRFRESLDSLGARTVAFTPLPDHHRFRPGEAASLVRAGLAAGAEMVLTTAKDAVRIAGEEIPSGLAVVDMEIEVDDAEGLLERLLALCLPGRAGGGAAVGSS